MGWDGIAAFASVLHLIPDIVKVVTRGSILYTPRHHSIPRGRLSTVIWYLNNVYVEFHSYLMKLAILDVERRL